MKTDRATGSSEIKEPKRDFVCAGCGYGVCVEWVRLPCCPMCGASSWLPSMRRRANGHAAAL